ncbi:Peptidyl-dipeptidase dcp [Polaromonas sp. CG9_12]|nr:Peptidyl-dipeptidase dcp [Polaromonas sp. CG9_12]
MMCGAEIQTLPEGVQRVAAVLRASGHAHAPVMLNDAARTAQQAADALGVSVGQIAKSIVFRRKHDDAAVLVVTSGDQRVDEKKVEALVCDGQRLGRADAAFVKLKTGFSIGGVAPLGHAGPVLVLIDASLFRFAEVWAATGHPHAVFRLSPQALVQLTQAAVADLAVDPQVQDHAIALLTLRAQTVPGALAVPSPCTSVCRMNGASGLCEGCFRSGAEIAGWSQAGEEGKRRIWRTIEQRMHRLQA